MQSAFPTFWIVRDDQGNWSWQLAVREGDFAARSSKLYASQNECLEAIRAVTRTTNVVLFGTLDDLATDAKAPAAAAPVPAASKDSVSDPLDLSMSQVADDNAADSTVSDLEAIRSRVAASTYIPTVQQIIRGANGEATKEKKR
jgi:uncharacterized protein YegP (UPF0339 family)